MTAPLLDAAVVLAVFVNLEVVAAVDQDLDRIGVISGASVYPLVWNILLAARNEGVRRDHHHERRNRGAAGSASYWACPSHSPSPHCCRWASRANS